MSQRLEDLDKKVERIRKEIALLLVRNEETKERIAWKEAYLKELLLVKDEFMKEK